MWLVYRINTHLFVGAIYIPWQTRFIDAINEKQKQISFSSIYWSTSSYSFLTLQMFFCLQKQNWLFIDFSFCIENYYFYQIFLLSFSFYESGRTQKLKNASAKLAARQSWFAFTNNFLFWLWIYYAFMSLL